MRRHTLESESLELIRQVKPSLRAAAEVELKRLLEYSESESAEDASTGSRTCSPFLARRTPRLFDYQVELVESIVSLFKRVRTLLVSLPTGAGKTRTALYACLQMLESDCITRVLWLAPTIELVDQAEDSLRSIWRDDHFGFDLSISPFREKSREPSFTFETIQSARPFPPKRFSQPNCCVVFDEAHHAAASTYEAVLRKCGEGGALVLGLSATPGRGDPKEIKNLARVFDNRLLVPTLLGTRPITALRSRGIMSELKSVCISSNPATIIDATLELVQAVQVHGAKKGVAFCATIHDSYVCAALLRASGISAEVVTHLQSKYARRAAIDRIREGKTSWLVNVHVLSTGIDVPDIDSIALLAKISSPILFEQILGRASRGPAIGGTPVALVFDAYDHFSRLGDPTSYARFMDIDPWM